MRVLKARPRAPRVSVFLVLAACLAALVSLYCEETIPAATERATTEATAAATETTQPPVQTDLPTDTATSTTTPAPSDGTGTPGTIPTTAPPTSRPATPGGGTPVLAPPDRGARSKHDRGSRTLGNRTTGSHVDSGPDERRTRGHPDVAFPDARAYSNPGGRFPHADTGTLSDRNQRADLRAAPAADTHGHHPGSRTWTGARGHPHEYADAAPYGDADSQPGRGAAHPGDLRAHLRGRACSAAPR